MRTGPRVVSILGLSRVVEALLARGGSVDLIAMSLRLYVSAATPPHPE